MQTDNLENTTIEQKPTSTRSPLLCVCTGTRHAIALVPKHELLCTSTRQTHINCKWQIHASFASICLTEPYVFWFLLQTAKVSHHFLKSSLSIYLTELSYKIELITLQMKNWKATTQRQSSQELCNIIFQHWLNGISNVSCCKFCSSSVIKVEKNDMKSTSSFVLYHSGFCMYNELSSGNVQSVFLEK